MEIPWSERVLANLVENRYEVCRSLSEANAFREVFGSIENSLNESVRFYQVQLEKSEIQNQAGTEKMVQVYTDLYEKFQKVCEEVMKKTENEVQILIENDFLKKELENETKMVEGYRKDLNKLEEQLADNEGKIEALRIQNSAEKQEIFQRYLKVVEELTENKGKEVKLSKDEEKKFKEHKVDEIEEFFPVVETEKLIKNIGDVRVYKEKYENLKKKYDDLKNEVERLLADIEKHEPEISLLRETNKKLLGLNESQSQEFYEYRQKNFYSKVQLESLNKKCVDYNEVILSQKAKISSLISDIYSLTSENHRLATGSNMLPEVSKKFFNCLDENLSLSQKLEKTFSEISNLKYQLGCQNSKLQELNQQIALKDEEIQQLKCRLSTFNSYFENSPSALAQLHQVLLEQNLIYKESELQEYKNKYSAVFQENFDLKSKYTESAETIKNLNTKLMAQTQEVFKLKINQQPLFSSPNPVTQPKAQKISEDSETKHQIRELLKEKVEYSEKINELYKELQDTRIAWAEEMTKLQGENEVMKMVANPEITEKLRDELGATKNYLKEIRYLLVINEKELNEERTKRIHCEKTLKRLRKAQGKIEKVKMVDNEVASLNKSLQIEKAKYKNLDEKLKNLQENWEKAEEEYIKSINSLRENYLHQQKTNEIHQRNIKTLLGSFNEISEMLERKKNECSQLERYLEEKKVQRAAIENLIAGQVQGKEVHEMCYMLHNRVEAFLALQDQDSFRSIYQIEEFKAEISKLKTDLCGVLKSNEKLKTDLETAEKQIENLQSVLKRSEHITKQPEILKKIVRLIHKSTQPSIKP